MIFLDVLYVSLSTIGIMALLQLTTFVVMKILYPPAPQVIYRNVPVHVPAPPQVQQDTTPLFPPAQKQVTFTQERQDITIPQHGPPPAPITTSVRMDASLPDGIQETRTPGT